MSANTFRWLVVVWLSFGFVALGIAMGHELKRCPYDPIDKLGAIASVVLVPALAIASFIMRDVGYPPCRNTSWTHP